MLAKSPSKPRNRLLAALTPADLDLVRPHLESVSLFLRKDLEKPNRPIQDVYFPDNGIASVVAVQVNDTHVEVGLVGCEGMTGTSVVLGNDRSPHSTYIQVAGEGQRIAAPKLRETMRARESLRGVFLRYVQVFMVQTAHTAIANARNKLDARLARWILMAHDRVKSNTLPLTHEFLSIMLGVRRAGVTDAVHSLESQNFIRTSRGTIVVLDRKGIERIAGGAYGAPEAEFRRLIG
jgi:CRP-like cAMP-binding protein